MYYKVRTNNGISILQFFQLSFIKKVEMSACTASKSSSTSSKTNVLVKSLLNVHFSIGDAGKEQMKKSDDDNKYPSSKRDTPMRQFIFCRYLRNKTKRRGAYFITFVMNLLVLDVIYSFSYNVLLCNLYSSILRYSINSSRI